MQTILEAVLRRFIRVGRLRVRWPDGSLKTFAGTEGPEASINIAAWSTVRKLVANPSLTLGECYMDGTLVPEDCTIYDVLDVLMTNADANPAGHPLVLARDALRKLRRRLDQYNPATRAQRNVAHHYDLNGRLYSLFLDRDRQYSCAYFPRGDETLEEAQLAKKRHIAAKLQVKDGHRVLDIGSGWGGLALYLGEFCRAKVTGVTLSKEQYQCATGRAAEKNLSRSVEFRMQDYRDIPEKFDRIVSVGMFEHVGVGYYDAYFRKCAELLADDGAMLLHSIGRSEGPNVTSPWIAKYIFPGGYIPALSEVLPAIERAGLLVTDIEILRLHYAETLKHWRDRFMAHREEAERIYDRSFVRMWEFYLAASEMTFREQAMMVMQIQLTKRQNVIPTTRDYIIREEARLRALEGGQRPPLRLAGE